MECHQLNTITLTRTDTCEMHDCHFEVTFVRHIDFFDEGQHLDGPRSGGCVECAKEKSAKLEAERKAREKREAANSQRELQYRIDASGIPSRFLECSLDNYVADHPGQKHALDVASDYVANFGEHVHSGCNLLFTGKPGCGKTHLAAAIGMAVIEMKGNVRYTTVADMVRRFTDTWKRHGESESAAMNDLTGADLLILDEAGVQSGSKVELDYITQVIDGRYRQQLPTLVISNLSIKDITPLLGDRSVDRLRDSGSQLVAFGWESYRGKKGVRNAA
ncbi:ATP-binding protein [Lysobacter sp. FW306-1B-D06B]|uniref:ATP-binding protein n=1 Tax=Lysobacter sp. FW306-1B-D06B TaxID=3140250 RepID=UPI00313FFCF7